MCVGLFSNPVTTELESQHGQYQNDGFNLFLSNFNYQHHGINFNLFFHAFLGL
jgi:hypothetical protein